MLTVKPYQSNSFNPAIMHEPIVSAKFMRWSPTATRHRLWLQGFKPMIPVPGCVKGEGAAMAWSTRISYN